MREPPLVPTFPAFALLSITRVGDDEPGDACRDPGDSDKVSKPGGNDEVGGDRPPAEDGRLPGDLAGGEVKGDDALLSSLLIAGRTGKSGNGKTFGCGRCVLEDEPIRDE
jgi:hypothetical protein